MKIKTFLAQGTQKGIENDIVVVVDVLRATSNVVTMFDRGATRVLLYENEEEARSQKLYYPNMAIAGERNCEKIKGFEMGNSPSETLSAKIKGREVALTTTNGTKAMIQACESETVLVGSIINMTAVCEEIARLVRQTGKDIAMLCSGVDGNPVIDDLYAAGAIINKSIMTGKIRGFDLDDASRVAKMVHGGFSRPLDALLASESGRNLTALGFSSDIALCAKQDLMNFVPKVKKDDHSYYVVCDDKQEA
ncbi:MAG: 2-phosphosulfolactate phosphatase [Caldisericales bacterium]|nr:2-phosphosulfolactate phosphatase [Caldisericales bacterium]